MWALVKSNSVDTVYDRVRAVIIGDIKHPKEIFTLWTEAERKAIGVYNIVRKDQPDNNFYDVGTPSYSYNSKTDKVKEDFTITEKDLAQLKSNLMASTQVDGDERIRPYDWLVSRYIFDNTKAIPSAVTTYTVAVRDYCETICTAIDGCSDLDAFKVVHVKMYAEDGEYNTWPSDSSIIIYQRKIS